jgi:hypothetical protein
MWEYLSQFPDDAKGASSSSSRRALVAGWSLTDLTLTEKKLVAAREGEGR